MLIVLAVLVALWYASAIYLNAPFQRELYASAGKDWTAADLVVDTLAQERPVLPAPHQVVAEIWKTTFEVPPTSKRSLVYHGWVTLSSTLLGFAIGTVLGILLAVGIVHDRAADRSPDALGHRQPDHPDPGHRADDHRRPQRRRAYRACCRRR